jgi:hypothetical protein
MELVTTLLYKMAPDLAMRSMFGVLAILLPYALMACEVWSSEKIKIMFGFWLKAKKLMVDNTIDSKFFIVF